MVIIYYFLIHLNPMSFEFQETSRGSASPSISNGYPLGNEPAWPEAPFEEEHQRVIFKHPHSGRCKHRQSLLKEIF
jgi:hypothetical protein